MNTQRILWSSLLVLSLLFATQLHAATSSINVVMIHGSNQNAEVHPRLKQYERNLKRIFKYTSYDLKGNGNTSVNLPGNSSINIGNGHSVQVRAEPSNGGKIKLTVVWAKSGRKLINTTMNVSRGHPTILGGPAARDGNGKLMLLIIAR